MELLRSRKSTFLVLPGLKGLMYHNNNSHIVHLEKKGFFQVSREIQSCWTEEEQPFFLNSDSYKSDCFIIL